MQLYGTRKVIDLKNNIFAFVGVFSEVYRLIYRDLLHYILETERKGITALSI